MLEYKVILGYVAVGISLIGYIAYFRNIMSGHTKPHAFSWCMWGLLAAIAFTAQVVAHGGAGSWVTGVTALFCFIVTGFALVKGKRNFVVFDWITLSGAIVALILWRITGDPTLSVFMVALTDFLSFLPTFRKGYYQPFEETALSFFLAALKWIVAIFALESYSLATWFYPASLIATNSIFVLMLLVRRKQLQTKA